MKLRDALLAPDRSVIGRNMVAHPLRSGAMSAGQRSPVCEGPRSVEQGFYSRHGLPGITTRTSSSAPRREAADSSVTAAPPARMMVCGRAARTASTGLRRLPFRGPGWWRRRARRPGGRGDWPIGANDSDGVSAPRSITSNRLPGVHRPVWRWAGHGDRPTRFRPTRCPVSRPR